jgi:hypothetical protein
MNAPGSPFLQASFVCVAAVVALALAYAFTAAARRAQVSLSFGGALAALGAWLALFAGVASSGVLSRFDLRPPPMMVLFVVAFGSAVAVSRSRVGRALSSLPLSALVGLQAFRLPLELAMHQAAAEHVMPAQMSFGEGGRNFDVVSGAVALVLGLVLLRSEAPRAVVWAMNVLGIALLANVLVVAFRSTPLVAAWGSSPDAVLTFVTHPPYVFLPTLLVPTALVGHVALTRRLLAEARAPEPA